MSCVSRKVPRRTEKEAEEVPRRGIQETDHVQQLGGYLPLSAVQASTKQHGTESWREQKGQIKYYIQLENDVQGFDFETET